MRIAICDDELFYVQNIIKTKKIELLNFYKLK